MTVEAISHHFSDGLYAKQMVLQKGHLAVSHKHNYSHLSILAQGEVHIRVDGIVSHHVAPACIEIKADAEHEILALQDVVWYCIHRLSDEDWQSGNIDEVLIQG